MDRSKIAEKYYNIRAAKGISARKLSMALGQSSEYLNQIENGHIMPSMESFLYFCDYCGITPREFFDDEQPSAQYKTLVTELNKLTEDELDHIIKTIKLIASRK